MRCRKRAPRTAVGVGMGARSLSFAKSAGPGCGPGAFIAELMQFRRSASSNGFTKKHSAPAFNAWIRANSSVKAVMKTIGMGSPKWSATLQFQPAQARHLEVQHQAPGLVKSARGEEFLGGGEGVDRQPVGSDQPASQICA